jgi:hypothetical protein
MFHSSAFAIAAGVVGVAGAATSAGMAMSAADKASRAQGRAGKKYQQQLGRATGTYEQRLKRATRTFQRQQNQLRQQVESMDVSINIPQYDLSQATLEGVEAANRVTANTLQQLETVAPGSAQARQQVGQIINSYLAGEVPQDVQEQITRMTAERAGAGFRPTQGGAMGPSGFQAAQGQLARNLGLTSLELQQTGANMASSWQQTANSFIQSPTQMMGLALQGRGQDINVAEANIRNRMNQLGMIGDINTGMFGAQRGLASDIFGAQTGQAQAGYGVAQQGIEATLASRQAAAQGVQGISSAAAGALGGIGSAYGQLAQAQNVNFGGQSYGAVKGFGGQSFTPSTTETGALVYRPKSGSLF